ncbi:hypothetical protein AB7196_14890, partial [Providencia rettgeri]
MREVKPTQKPVPSSDIKDLFFNSGLLDIWATSLEPKYIDRFGNCHLTAAGMEWLFKELVEKFKVDMNIAILAAGYAPVGSFQKGAEVKRYNETVLWKLPDGDGEYYRWDGDLPKSVPENSTPETTGGIKTTDNPDGLWVSVGDASLRSDISKQDGFSYIGTCKSIEQLKLVRPRFLHQQQPVIGFYSDTPYRAGGMFFSADSSSFEVDNWVVFPSADPSYVWVRQGMEKERTILNFGAREGQDITEFLLFAATKGLTIIQDNPFDVKTTGGILLGKGVKIKGDDESEGFIVLDSANFDEIFLPNKSEHCYFKAEKARFKAVTCKSNTPYVCGVTMEDPVTSLIEYKMHDCVLNDIGETSDMLYGYNVDVVKTDNKIKMSKGMID